jgi:hypothetical protein
METFKTLKIAECKEGMRVKLTKPDPYYTRGKSNPSVGTEYECGGEITEVSGNVAIVVRWDNGFENSYKDDELTIEEFSGKVVSIW